MLLRFVLLLLALLPLSSLSEECRRLTASGNSEYPPYLWRAGDDSLEMLGAIPKLMDYVSQQLGIEVVLKYVGPWGRVQEEVAEGEIDLIAGAFYTVPRSYRMDYIRPAFQKTRTAVWVRKAGAFPYKQWSDLLGRSGVTVINNSFGQAFDEYAEHHLNIHEAVRLKQGLNMLLGGRVEYFIYEDNPARAYAAELGILDQIEALDVPIGSEDLFLTISKKSDCNTPELRQKLSDILISAQQQELMKQYLKQGISEWEARTQ